MLRSFQESAQECVHSFYVDQCKDCICGIGAFAGVMAHLPGVLSTRDGVHSVPLYHVNLFPQAFYSTLIVDSCTYVGLRMRMDSNLFIEHFVSTLLCCPSFCG